MSGLSETISFAKARPPEELGGDITRTCISLLDGRDRRFAKVLSDGRIFENVSAALAAYLEKLEAAHPDEVMTAVSVTMNDYLEQLGIGLMSCRVEPLNSSDDSLKLPDEAKSPTVGVIPEIVEPGRMAILACFKVDKGGEEITAITENLCMRGYLPSEYPPYHEVALQPLPRGRKILVPQNAAIGARVRLFDEARLIDSGSYDYTVPLVHDDLRIRRNRGATPEIFEPGQVYFCRYLTKEAVREALGL